MVVIATGLVTKRNKPLKSWRKRALSKDITFKFEPTLDLFMVSKLNFQAVEE